MTTLHKCMTIRRVAGLVLIAGLLTFSLSGTVFAETPAITKAKQEAEALRALVEQLDTDLGMAAEDYNYVSQQLSDTKATIEKTTALLKAAERDRDVAEEQFTERLVGIYKQGNVGALDVLFEADDFSDLVGRYNQLSRISEQDAELVTQLQAHTKQVTDQKTALATQLQDQEKQAAELAAAKQRVEQQLARQKTLLKGKEAQIAQLQREEEERQRRLAAERAAAERAAREREAAEARAVAAQQAARPSGSGNTSNSTAASGNASTTTPKTTAKVPSSAKGSQVVSIAMQYLGVPYVWGGSSPQGFDCSGLVMYAYKQVGVSLPHSSRMMYGYGTSVSRDQLQPGDLVFFYSPISHVGIYIGSGQMVNARSGGVKVDSIWKSYVGAKRIL